MGDPIYDDYGRRIVEAPDQLSLEHRAGLASSPAYISQYFSNLGTTLGIDWTGVGPGAEQPSFWSGEDSPFSGDPLDINVGTDFFNQGDNTLNGEGAGANEMADVTQVSGMQNMPVSQQDLGISTAAVGSREELSRMLTSYTGRTSLIQSAQRQKAIFTIDRFDGGINLNKSPRDLSYWEACQMDELTPSKVGRLIRLGDFSVKISASSDNGLELLQDGSTAVKENYGLHYFKWSDSLNAAGTFAGEISTNYLATADGTDIHLWNLGNSAYGANDTVLLNVITGMNANTKAVYHNAANRVYVSDAAFTDHASNHASKTLMFGIIDRPELYPRTSAAAVTYNISGNTANKLFVNQPLYHAAPVAGVGNGDIMVSGKVDGSGDAEGLTHTDGGTGGIYINAQFEAITGDEVSGTGWGATTAGDAKHYRFFASFLYDDGAESKLTDVTSSDNSTVNTATSFAELDTATTASPPGYQKLVIKQVKIDGTELYTNYPRVHGARFYYTEVAASTGIAIGNDKYLWAELDFRYGFKLMSEHANWNLFEDDNITPTAIQVVGAAETDGNTTPDGTLSINNPPKAFTYYTNNLFNQEELKDDLLWATSTMGNGIAFIGNVKYDGRQYPDTMLYSGAGETDAGSAYPMWGTFPVDSNRIDIPGTGGSITALKWVANRVLQFRKNALYIVNVEDVLAPKVEGVHQGMGAFGQYAVTETPFGVAWVNENGCYAYNAEEKKARSLTIGRLDSEDFGADVNSKIGYDDRAKMLIITNSTKYDTDGYHYAYSFVTDAWCTWNANKAYASNVTTNFAIDHDGYLTGAIEADGQGQGGGTGTTLNVYKWSAEAQAAQTVEYITKDIDFGKPNLDKRFYTIYISYTGGTSNEINVHFRVNGREGKNLTDNWVQLSSILDFTDPYADSTGDAWDTSGSPTTGDPYVPSADDGLDSKDTGEQKLAKINLRAISGSLPADYFKFARSIQLRFEGTAATTFEINDISLVYKEKRLK